MDIDTLMQEAELLVRNGEQLTPSGIGAPVGWTYPRVSGEPSMAVVVAGRVLCLVPDGNHGAGASYGDAAPAGGTPLFASPWRSYPPIEGIFLRGSERIGDWLAENRWERTWGYNDNFPDRRVVSEYEAWWQGQHPFYTSTAVAVRGGWHFVWPDDDWLERVDEELVLWTLSGEPWLEVWARAGGLQVLERTT
ncbi:MAG: hypothetical protein U0230_13085 [Polyangiales bacterium]